MLKKLSFLLALVMIFACFLTACNQNTDDGKNNDDNNDSTNDSTNDGDVDNNEAADKDDESGDDVVEEPTGIPGFSDANFRYVSYKDGWGIAAVEGLQMAEVSIPATANGRPVLRIEEGGFANNTSIVSVTIPESVKVVYASAFEGCTSLETIELPDSVMYVGNVAFDNTAYSNNEENWDGDVLYLGNHLIDAKLTIEGSYSVKEGTVTIACHAFADRDDFYGYMGCEGLTSVTFPSSLKVIGDGAFQNCTALAEFSVSDDVVYLGNYAFHNTAYFNDKLNDEDSRISVFYLGMHLVQANPARLGDEYTVDEGTLSIAGPAFKDCVNLTEIIIPDSVTHIGYGAFQGCESLITIVFEGTAEQWENITKDYGWNHGAGNFEIVFD